MLEDRDYMRRPEYLPRVTLTVVLLVVNAIIFVVECFALGYPPRFSLDNHFPLSLEGLEHGFVWQLLTYQFMHANVWHIVANSWLIYLFGREIEETLGPKQFLVLFLTSGVAGGIFQVIAALLWPHLFGGPVVGASASGLGLMAAYAVLFPERELTLLFPPVTFQAKTLLIFSAVLALAGIVFPVDNVANAAHLGGMLTGLVFIRQFVQGRGLLWGFHPDPAGPREFAGTRTGKTSFWRSSARPPDEGLSTDEFVKSEVDPILDKISQHGIQSLTERERQILEKARARMAKR
ncbi:MAG: rhomboid family intramembrane serine protease [Verrucomicrobiia bacterium]